MVLKENKRQKETEKKASSPKKASTENEQKNSDTGKNDKKSKGIKELKELLASEKDKTLRLSAEFENFKKRKQREIDDFKKFANETVFKQFLSVVDNLERAITSAEKESDDASLLEGVKLTLKEILKLFATFNVTPVEAQDQPFDPNFHQAVTQQETDEVPDNTVVSVLQKGYLLHDRLIRPAMVVVSKRVEKETEKNTEK
ncbi:MAG: nucleotide exchange factor GrpE [Desulfobacter sp.]|nr:nucleotide exchange factor GrpE [Desulfobacter sp.]